MNDGDTVKSKKNSVFYLNKSSPSFSWSLDGAGLICAISYAALAWYSLRPEFLSLWMFYSFLGICLFATLIAFSRSDEKSLSPMRLLFWTCCFHLIGVLGDPLWEDDFFRYLWDGYRFYETGTPYGVAPSEFFGDGAIPEKFQALLARINYPNIPTIYGPTLEYTFLLSHVLAPAKIWPLQLIYTLADLTLVLLLLRLVSARWVLLYAWSPLVIKELAFTAHPDGVGVLLMMLALYFRQQKVYSLAAGFIALSVGAKVFALLMVPFVLWRTPLRYWVLFLMLLGLLYSPFIWRGASDMQGLLTFATQWQFNSSIYAYLLQWFDAMSVKLILASVFLAAYTWIFWRHCRANTWQMPRGDIIFGLFLIISPVVNAWYVIWLLPFAVFFPRLWSWTFSICVLLSYAVGINMAYVDVEPLQIPLWVLLLEYGLILIAACLDAWFRVSGSNCPYFSKGNLEKSNAQH